MKVMGRARVAGAAVAAAAVIGGGRDRHEV